MNSLRLLLASLLWWTCLNAVAEEAGAISYAVVGGVFQYMAQPGDKLGKIGARYGVSASILALDNNLQRNAALRAGVALWVDNQHIVPAWREEGIVINLPQRMLFFFHQGELAAAFPVGLGRPDWPTPTGDFKVVDLQTDKEWVVPPSIQEEMRQEGKTVITRVPPGPKNPLGRYWIGLSASGYGIHGTLLPSSLYGFPSHGCIRVHPDDIEALSQWVQVGMGVVSIYRNTLLAETQDGRVFLEVHRDIYKRGVDPMDEIHKLAQAYQLVGRINWPRALEVAQRQDGLAIDVTLMQ